MQHSPRTSIDSVLQNIAIDRSIKKQLEECLSPTLKENEELKQKIEQLKTEANQYETKFSNVRQQLQLLHFLFDLEKLIQHRTVEQLGSFFSALLNRHPQRARKQFSAFGELFYSANRETAKSIKKDLEKVHALLLNFRLEKKAKLAQAHIRRLDEKHDFENL